MISPACEALVLPIFGPHGWATGNDNPTVLRRISRGSFLFCAEFQGTVDVIYVASNKDNTAPGASGEVQDHQEHHRDDQEKLQDHFYEGFIRF